MQPEVKLLDRAPHEIDQIIAEWVAGKDESMEALYEILLSDQGSDPCVDEEATDDGDCVPPPSSRATHLVDDTISWLEVTPLNLKRIISWCGREASPAGYEALLTSFAGMLTKEQRERYCQEAVKLFIPEVVHEWLGDRTIRT